MHGARSRQHDSDLHDFRGLQAHRTDLQPALRPEPFVPEKLDAEQQQQRHAVNRIG
jgi:hypothetical protein